MSDIKIGIIGGSGLDDPDILKNRKELSVETPFGLPSDVLIQGEISKTPCVLLARHGRKHSIMPGKVNYRANIWALKQQGCTHVIATTATGSLQENIKPGDLVIPNSFIDRTTKREQTFYDGEEGHPIGVCHIPMEPAYCEKSRELIIKVAEQLGYPVHKTGTIVTIEGPRFGSKAESLMHRQWGAHLVNMTTVPEVILAKEAGLLYVSIALATDYDCWKSGEDRLNVPEILQKFKENVSKVTDLILKAVPVFASEDWTNEYADMQKMIKDSVMLPH